MQAEVRCWNVFNTKDIYDMLHFVSEKFYGISCAQYKTSCCTNQALEVHKPDIQRMAKQLGMDVREFRKKYTMTKENFVKKLMGMSPESEGKVTMSKVGGEMMKQPGRLVIFEPSDDMMELDNPVEFDGKKHTKTSVSYCPFFDRGEHRCKVYEARPMACREYPFQKVNKNQIEVRKASACLITNEFLGRFMAFLATIPNDNVTAYLKELTGIVESKQYYNHLHLPWVLVVMYLGYEFHSHKMEPLAIALLQRLDLEAKMEAEHAGTRRN